MGRIALGVLAVALMSWVCLGSTGEISQAFSFGAEVTGLCSTRNVEMVRSIRALMLSPFVSQKMSFFGIVTKKEDLEILKALIEDGKVTPIIDKPYPLRETPKAVGYPYQGHARVWSSSR